MLGTVFAGNTEGYGGVRQEGFIPLLLAGSVL
jgi:hypothetical protein